MKYQILVLSIMVSSCFVDSDAMSGASKKNALRVKKEPVDYSIYGVRKAIQASDFETFEIIMNKLADANYDFKAEKDSQGRNLLLLACTAKTIDRRILTRLINLEIDPLQKAKGFCALDVIINKIEKNFQLADLKEFFSEETWAAWEDAKEAQRQAEIEEAKALELAKSEKIDEENNTQESQQQLMLSSAISGSTVSDESNISVCYTVAHLHAAITFSDEQHFTTLIDYFNRTDKSVFYSVDAKNGMNLINLAVRVNQPKLKIISLLLNLDVDSTLKATDNQSAIDIIRSRTDLETEISLLFPETLRESQQLKLTSLAEDHESSSDGSALEYADSRISPRPTVDAGLDVPCVISMVSEDLHDSQEPKIGSSSDGSTLEHDDLRSRFAAALDEVSGISEDSGNLQGSEELQSGSLSEDHDSSSTGSESDISDFNFSSASSVDADLNIAGEISTHSESTQESQPRSLAEGHASSCVESTLELTDFSFSPRSDDYEALSRISKSGLASDYDIPPRHRRGTQLLSPNLDISTSPRKKQNLSSWKKNSFLLVCAGAFTTYAGLFIKDRYIRSKQIKKNDAN